MGSLVKPKGSEKWHRDCQGYQLFTCIQVDDKQARLDETLDYQQRYQDALYNISGWLDDIELRLFDGTFQQDTEQHLKDNNVR